MSRVKHSEELKKFCTVVENFWRAHGRHNLPWRKTSNPYAILVSEIMLQQTQVERVIPYFQRWMKRYPTVQKLAKASLADVLKEWSGLGYNRRAKMLHECAKEIVEKHGGAVPKDCATLKALPGIGPYTAGAIRVFAFNEPDVLIETNIRTVYLHHFFPNTHNVSDRALCVYAEKAAQGRDPRTWHAALMDYGAHLKTTHPNPSRRSKHHAKQSKFEGSLRQVRGAILKAVTRGESQSAVRKKYERHYDDAYMSLARDGLVG